MRIVVVGGGSSAIFLLENLIEESPGLLGEQRHALTVISSQAPPGDRRAFGMDLPAELILNTPNCELDQLVPGWREFRLLKGGSDTSHSARSLFGSFLVDRWANLKGRAASVFEFATEVATVRRVSASSSGFLVETDSSSIRADLVVLCVGSPARDESIAVEDSAAHPDVCDVYGTAIQEINKESSVAILGSRLTAIDALLRLRGQGHLGPIHVASPSGRLPRVRRLASVSASPINLPWLAIPTQRRNVSLREAWRLARHVLGGSLLELRNLLDSRPTTKAFWAQELREAESSAGREWQTKAYQASALMEDLWPHLSPSAQAQFLLKYRSRFLSNLVGIPLQSAGTVMDMMECGQLSVHGGLAAVGRGGTCGHAARHKLEFVHGATLETDYLIDATGQRAGSRSPAVLSSLAASGLVSFETNGSLSTDRFTCEVRTAFNNPGMLLCVGDLSLGRNFVSSSLETNRRQAIRASRTLLGSLAACDTRKAGTLV